MFKTTETLEVAFIANHDSIKDAARLTEVGAANIANTIKGYRGFKTCGGYIWKYAAPAPN